MMNKADIKEYNKAYYAANRDEIKAQQKAYRESHRDEIIAKKKASYAANRDDILAKQKAYYAAHRDEIKAQQKAYRESHKAEWKAYQKADTNSNGVSKDYIRKRSRYYLFNVLKHTKMPGYEIHHCFGYNDYRNFIYIPRSLHLQIHQYLRDNNIDADTDHYSKIAHLVVGWDGYVYIKD